MKDIFKEARAKKPRDRVALQIENNYFTSRHGVSGFF